MSQQMEEVWSKNWRQFLLGQIRVSGGRFTVPISIEGPLSGVKVLVFGILP